MGRFLVLFLLFFAYDARAAFSLGTVPSFSLCSSLYATPSDNTVFSIHCFRPASSTNGVNVCYKNGAPYQVPTDKNFRVECVEYSSSSAGNENMQLVAGTSVSGTDPKNPGGTITYEFGSTSIYGWPVLAASTWYSKPFVWFIDEALYPGIQGSTAPSHEAILHGREINDPAP